MTKNYSQMKWALVLLALSLSASLSAQTTVYLRDNPYSFTISGCTNATPMVCTVSSTAGLSTSPPNNIVAISSVCANNPATYYISPANGIRTITAMLPGAPGTMTLADLHGSAIAGNGAWCDGSLAGDPWAASAQYGGKVTAYTLAAGLKGYMFDGDNGAVTRQWALGTQNGLTSLVCNGSSCTATTSYAHGVITGQHVSVFETTNSSLNLNGISSDYTVSSATTYTFLFPSSVAASDYTSNPTCGPGSSATGTYGNYPIGGTQNCVRISQRAVTTNPYWAAFYNRAGCCNGTFFTIDGGGISSTGVQSDWEWFATRFLVDQKDTAAFTAVMYALTHAYEMGGATFIANEANTDGGAYDLGSDIGITPGALAQDFIAGQAYLTPTLHQAFIDQMLNDIADPVPCTKTLATAHDTLASGTAQAGSSTSITLAESDSHVSGYYVNNMVELGSYNAGWSYGLVTAYNSSTKVVTVASWSGAAPTAGTAYKIYSTITLSGNAVTGYNTHFTSNVSLRDAVYGINPGTWDYTGSSGSMGSWVTAVNSDTSLTVVNMSGGGVTAGSTPSTYIYAPKWATGACGMWWVSKYSQTTGGSQPASYPVRGGTGAGNGPSNLNLQMELSYASLFMVLADYDSRAVTDLAIFQMHAADYNLGPFWNYITGITTDGSNYGLAMSGVGVGRYAWLLSHAVTGFPSVNPAQLEQSSYWKIYGLRSDAPYYPDGSHDKPMIAFGNEAAMYMNYATWSPMVIDAGMAFNPAAASSGYLKYLLDTTLGFDTASQYSDEAAVKIDPRIVATNYSALPKQYLFTTTDNSVCSAITGSFIGCSASQRGDVVYSRSGWTNLTDTNLFFSARTLLTNGDHDNMAPGTFQLWKGGALLGNDNYPVGQSDGLDASVQDSSPAFGNSTFNSGYGPPSGGSNGIPAVSDVVRWASANHGSWAANFGDRNSNYMYAMADLSGAYTVAYNRVQRSLVHLKKAGLEELVLQFDDIDATGNATSIAVHTHYPQNGETASAWPYFSYDEGSTGCPGGCASLNTNRVILEQENGIANAHGDPAPQYNLISKFLLPGGAANVFVTFDGSTYSGSNGHTNRVSLCADASSTGTCGAAGQSKLELLTVHKVAIQPDTALTATALNPDANWTGVQVQDATVTGGAVVLFARGGATHQGPAAFTTSHSGTAQYLIAGLTAGSYRVTVGGNTVLAEQTVSDGDNTLYFESTAGAVVIQSSAQIVPGSGSVISSGATVTSGAIRH